MERSAATRHAQGTPRLGVANGRFLPHRVVRNGHVQTLLSRYRPRQVLALLEQEAPLMVDAGPDQTGFDPSVRLLGYYTRRRTEGPSHGLVISLHGWEGSSHAVHNLVMADAWVTAGFDVFRLNLRDHGPRRHVVPQGLNHGLFLGTLLDETVAAVQRAAELAGDAPVYLVGPSMGGNFALRVAVAHAVRPIPNLRKVVTISPAINPGRSTDQIDAQPMFHYYFRRRWLRSLLIKQQLFPDLYQFDPLRSIQSLRAMTEWLVTRYAGYPSADAYFADYAVLGDALADLRVATTIITAANDGVIPVADFYALAPSPYLQIQVHPTGGHVGFLDLGPLRHCLPEMVLAELTAEPVLADKSLRCDTMAAPGDNSQVVGLE
ncbi:MAG: hypothetical protein DCC57_01350 [Chloroflexi bacterium]|nr:MAG: hypothetical protein DCC57_01350 [Chloroflexota bacterium]